MKLMWMFIVSLILVTSAFAANPNFYATEELQTKYPEAFATQSATLQFHLQLNTAAKQERELLVKAIKRDKKLYQAILQFSELNLEEQVSVLHKLFILECQVLQITPPELIIDETSIPGYAFFEFSYQTGGAGKVFLNKKKLKEEKNKTEFILLLLHETRHSKQFQMSQNVHDALSRGYRASFEAQSGLKIKSFCDFMLLLNEYEAFQFGNYVYGALIEWQTPINDMGTLASQFDQHGELRMNMIEVLQQTQMKPIELFNQLEKQQYEVMYE